MQDERSGVDLAGCFGKMRVGKPSRLCPNGLKRIPISAPFVENVLYISSRYKVSPTGPGISKIKGKFTLARLITMSKVAS